MKKALLGVLFLGACVSPKGPPKNTKTEFQFDIMQLIFGEPREQKVTIEEILASCGNNRLRCEKDYGTTWVVVTGAFFSINDFNVSLLDDTRPSHLVFLSPLTGGSWNSFLQCIITKSVKADDFLRTLNRGDILRAHGVLTPDDDVPALRECWVERGAESTTNAPR